MKPDDDSLTNGPAWASVLAAAIGCASFGLLVDLSEAFPPASHALNFYTPTGDLSGKSTVALVCWLSAWAALHSRWKRRDVDHPGRIAAATIAILILALVSTFPPLFGLFATD